MRIGQVNASFHRHERPARHKTGPDALPASRALVTTAAEPATEQTAGALHREAAFLAHLIATKEQEPQTRARRRAEPAVAIAAYRDTGDLVERTVSRPRPLLPV